MSKVAWLAIKEDKNFNIRIFRLGLTLLIISFLVSALLSFLSFYFYIKRPERDYYATSGIIPPIQLQALSAPNRSSQALLPSDPPTEEVQKLIPQ